MKNIDAECFLGLHKREHERARLAVTFRKVNGRLLNIANGSHFSSGRWLWLWLVNKIGMRLLSFSMQAHLGMLPAVPFGALLLWMKKERTSHYSLPN